MKLQFKDVEHLLRMAALMVAGVILFVIVRAALVPDDFGLYGHYRAQAIEVNRAKAIVYAGQQACADCHDDVVKTRAEGPHVRVACEGCHGPAAAHAGAPDQAKLTRPDGRQLCARCHAAKTGKPSWYRTVDLKEHAGEESCLSCHTPHNPRIQ